MQEEDMRTANLLETSKYLSQTQPIVRTRKLLTGVGFLSYRDVDVIVMEN